MNRDMRIKLVCVTISLVIFGIYIIYSLIYIPINTKNSFTPKILYASRGDIYSFDYQLMSTSPIMFNIGIDPLFAKKKNKNFETEIKKLAADLANKFEQSKEFFESIKNELDDEVSNYKKVLNTYTMQINSMINDNEIKFISY